MFSESDDDLGVFDDDFLCEVFHPAGQQGVGEGEQDNNPQPAPLQCPQVTNKTTHQWPEKVSKNQSHPSTPLSLALTNHMQDKQAKDQSESETDLIPDGDTFDDFFSDLVDLEDDLTTPPDNAFTRPQGKEICAESTLHQDDFRARILKVIKTRGDETSSARLSARKEEDEEERKKIEEEEEEEKRRSHIPVSPLISQRNNSSAGIPRSVSGPHKRKTETSAHLQLIQKRKFPGPAGLLPQMGQTRSEVTTEVNKDMTPRDSQVIVCSQSSADDYTSGPWQKMLHDLELDSSDPAGPLGLFNVRWVTCRAGLRGGAGVRRVPFLAVKVKSVDAVHSHPTVTLLDPTGEIKGTISEPVLQEFGHTLTPGAVLVLRGVTVLSPGVVREARSPRPRRHYLNITRSTVLTIYTPNEAGNIITTNVEDFDCRNLRRELLSPTTGVCAPCAIIEEEEEDDQGDGARSGRLLQHADNTGNSAISGSLFSRVGGITGGDGARLASPGSLGRASAVPQGRGVSPGVPQGRGGSGVPSRMPGGVGSVRLQGMSRVPPPSTASHPTPPAPCRAPAPPFCPPTVPHRTNSQTSRPPHTPQTSTPASLHPHPLPHKSPSHAYNPPSTLPIPSQQPSHSLTTSLPPPPSRSSTVHPSRPLSCPPPPPPAPSTSSLNRSIFSSQAEEEEVKEMLDNLDEDSLFGDF